MTSKSNTEEPCIDGHPCEWFSEEWYDTHGDIERTDLYCDRCGRWRDWSKDEMEEIK